MEKMRSHHIDIVEAPPELGVDRSKQCRQLAARWRNLAGAQSIPAARTTLLGIARDYEHIADSLDLIQRSEQWLKKASHTV